MFSIVIVTIANLWGIDFENLASAGVGAQFAGRLLEILLILAIGYFVWEVVTLLINRKLAAEMTAAGFDLDDDEPGGGEGGGVWRFTAFNRIADDPPDFCNLLLGR